MMYLRLEQELPVLDPLLFSVSERDLIIFVIISYYFPARAYGVVVSICTARPNAVVPMDQGHLTDIFMHVQSIRNQDPMLDHFESSCTLTFRLHDPEHAGCFFLP
jgi:hypothetical protein